MYRIILAIMIAILIGPPLRAAGAPSLSALFSGADTVLVGDIDSIKRSLDPEIPRLTPPRDPIQGFAVSPCEISIRVSAVLKSKGSSNVEGTSQRVIWYTPTRTPCAAGSWGFDTDVRRP